MSINLSNVNISLDEFQKISSGWFNAGEVRLKDEHSLAKVNHHVETWWFSNKEKIDHKEVLAIKQAFVNALSQHGIQGEALARIRRDLGLAPMDAADKSLVFRSVVPLTRQKIREILDEHAATLNQSAGHERIRTQEELHANKTQHQRGHIVSARAEVNAALDARDKYQVNSEIARFEKVVSDFGDFSPWEERQELLGIAKAQLEALMESCQGLPRADRPATATFTIPGGQSMTVGTGLSEAEFAERLENMVVRFSEEGPEPEELEVTARYRGLKSHAERQAFLDALPNDPVFGLKARALAVRCLHSCKVADYATLSAVNRLSAADALLLARTLLALPQDTTPGQVRANPQVAQLLAREPVAVPKNEQAYVPATSHTQYNRFVHSSMTGSTHQLLPAHRKLAASVRQEVRARLGEVAMPDDTTISGLVHDKKLAGIYYPDPAAWEARRSSAENIRGSYLATALQTGALKIVQEELANAIRAAGGRPDNAWMAAVGMQKRHPEFIRTLAGVGTPDQARVIVAEYREQIERQARLYCKAAPLAEGIGERMRQVLAAKLGIPREAIGEERLGIATRLGKTGLQLFNKILAGKVPAETDGEVEAAFANLVEETVAELTDRLRQVDALDPPLPPHAADQVKTTLCALQEFDNIDVAHIAGEVRERVHAGPLDALLRGNADKAAIQAEMVNVKASIDAILDEILAGRDEIGPDDLDGIRSIATSIAIAGHPGLADRLDAFFLGPDVKAEIEEHDDTKPATLAMDVFREQSFHPDVFAAGPGHARQMQALFTGPREVAAFKAAGGEPASALAGYHVREIPLLAKCFALHKEATGCTDEEAMAAALDPKSKARQLLDCGGRFLRSAEAFREGLRLMDLFRAWYPQQAEAMAHKQKDTPTRLNCNSRILTRRAMAGMEKFLFEEIAVNPRLDLHGTDPEALFGARNNRAMRCVGLAYADGCLGTLASVPPAVRGVVYDIADLFHGPLAETAAEAAEKEVIDPTGAFISRILAHLDDIEGLRGEGHFDRAHLVALLYPDLQLPPNPSNQQIGEAFFNRVEAIPPEITNTVQFMASESGATLDECIAAANEGRRLPLAPYVSSVNPSAEQIAAGADLARKTMLQDMLHPECPSRIGDQAKILAQKDTCYTFTFPDGRTFAGRTGSAQSPETMAANNAIADRVERLCGKVHGKQLSSLFYILSQNGSGFNVDKAFRAQGIDSSEHMPLSFTLSRDDETGAVTVVCQEPNGFKDQHGNPIRFHWTTTVALDGTVASTPMVVEAPPPPQQPPQQPAEP